MSNQSPIMKTSVTSKVFQNIALNVYNKKNPKMQVISFSQINSAKLAKDNSGHAISCPDQYIAIIKVIKGKIVEFCPCFDFTIKVKRSKNSTIISKMNDIPVMAIVLESPHKDEFDNNQAVGPAMGETCKNFRIYFEEMLEGVIANNQCELVHLRYKIVFINPIQYQCSLGACTKKYKDYIFTKMWDYQNKNEENEVKNDFIKRLESHNPEIIINCCTKGNFDDKDKDKYLQVLVQKVINEYCKDKNILKLESPHPSSWHDKKNRHITKVK